MKWELPLDIPLVTPTLGLPIWLYDALLVIVFVVHITFIYTLLGASFASVLYNITGVWKKSKVYDDLAYRLTNFTTVSENMGALWGVAPLLIIGVLYTGFFYTAIIKISPHILHIIYGNILAFLLSYAYKFSWKKMQDHKGFHILIGSAMLILFFSLPFVFMSMTNLYMQPELFGQVKDIWDVMLTPLTGLRLLNFFLTTFTFFGAVMIFFATRWNDPEDAEIRKLAIDQGKKWILFSAPLNVAILPLVLFAFSPRIGEGLMKTWFIALPFLAALILFWMVVYLIKQFTAADFSRKEGTALFSAMLVTVLLMATGRQGLRVVSFEEPVKVQAEATQAYMNNMLVAYHEERAREKDRPEPAGDERQQLAEKKGCLACHSVEIRLVGPAYKQVAAKYRSPDEIITSILKGSKGKWPELNGVAMPPNQVTEAEARKLAEWILEQR
ncbi:MAG: c-type cytochrome [Leptonema illini]|uniref:C-type cytochrome n=1 Tax=Leptonema illini TaxID=183 RepID=A0A833H3H4_9LEPT|nr:MAG: c-type cytochrome [Leptonema illini]PKL34311.1 MAG: cytochrome C [Spirochaetae bacterium HGW-Spirochaetae-10]